MMIVNWMSDKLISISPDQTVNRAMMLMEQNHIHRLPVIIGNELVGIVSDRDIKGVGPSNARFLEVHELLNVLDRHQVKDIMTERPCTVHINDTIEAAADLMLRHRVGGLPVVDDERRVRGMITQYDINRALVCFCGVARGGIQLGLKLPDRPESIKEAIDVIYAHGGKIANILMSDDPGITDPKIEGWIWAFMRVTNLNRPEIDDVRQELDRVGQVIYVLGGHGDQKGEAMFIGDRPGAVTRREPSPHYS